MLDKLHYRLYNCIIRKFEKEYGGKYMERTVKMKRSDLAMAHNNLVKVISDIATSGEEKELTNEERLSVIKNLSPVLSVLQDMAIENGFGFAI